MGSLEVKLTSVDASLRLQSLRIPRFQTSLHTASSNFSKLWFKCSYHFMTLLASNPSKLISTLLLSLQILGQWFALQLLFSNGSKESHWFSVCSVFFLYVWQWWFLSSLHVEAEIGSCPCFWVWYAYICSRFVCVFLFSEVLASLVCCH